MSRRAPCRQRGRGSALRIRRAPSRHEVRLGVVQPTQLDEHDVPPGQQGIAQWIGQYGKEPLEVGVARPAIVQIEWLRTGVRIRARELRDGERDHRALGACVAHRGHRKRVFDRLGATDGGVRGGRAC
jgi:hypothetical protein